MNLINRLAKDAMKSSKGFKLLRGETVKVDKGVLIQLYSNNLTAYHGVEGVRINRAPKPKREDAPYRTDSTVKKMIIMSNLINEELHVFKELIILN